MALLITLFVVELSKHLPSIPFFLQISIIKLFFTCTYLEESCFYITEQQKKKTLSIFKERITKEIYTKSKNNVTEGQPLENIYKRVLTKKCL